MKKYVVLTDIDGTIIHSARFYADGDILVESSGTHKGYMGPSVARVIESIANVATVIPVTSRSIDQYLRINWPAGTKPVVAIVTNGANLVVSDLGGTRVVPLVEDVNQGFWRQELDATKGRIGAYSCVRSARIVDDSYVLAILDGTSLTQEHPSCLDVDSSFSVFREGKKVYCFPPHVNKSLAVAYLRKTRPNALIIAAGDSLNDIAMLMAADYAFAPSSLEHRLTCSKKATFIASEIFESTLMPCILNLIAREPVSCLEG